MTATTLTKEEEKELEQLIKDGHSYVNIKSRYPKISKQMYSYRKVKLGLARKRRKNNEISSPQQKLYILDSEIKALQAQLELLKKKKEELSIFFEHADNYIIVHGIGSSVVQATAHEWLYFLNQEGARRLREFITEVLAQSNGKRVV